MKDTIFREYDIRGIVDSELIINEIYDLSKAIACYFKSQNKNVETIVVGVDCRIHSNEIKNKLCEGLIDSGLNVIFIGQCSTPVLYFSLFNLPVDAGLMVTASHNSKEYNGIKICLGIEPVCGKEIRKIREIFKKHQCLDAKFRGKYSEHFMIDSYVNWFFNNFKNLIGFPISLLIDCANATAGFVLPQLIKKMEWPNVSLLFGEIDGNFPNHEPDPTQEKNMECLRLRLSEGSYSFGIGFDGDCDRMAIMTSSGHLIPGDKLLSIFATEILKNNPGSSIICDVISSSGLLELLETLGAKIHISPCGHSIIKKKINEYNALLAGELSGHFTFKDRYFGYDDGIYALFRLMEIIKNTGKSIDELLIDFPQKISSPEIRIGYKDLNKKKVMKSLKNYFEKRCKSCNLLTLDGIKVIMNYGWGIVRPSNTQPVLSLRFESDSFEGLLKIKNEFKKSLEPFFDARILESYLQS